MQTHNTRVVSSNPTRVTIKAPLVRKANGNHLIKSTSLDKSESPVSGFCLAELEIVFAMQSQIATGGSDCSS